jgi:hypothetical protein
VYDYKTINPAPQMRFTRNEADANKWVAELDQKGYVSYLLYAFYFRAIPARSR